MDPNTGAAHVVMREAVSPHTHTLAIKRRIVYLEELLNAPLDHSVLPSLYKWDFTTGPLDVHKLDGSGHVKGLIQSN